MKKTINKIFACIFMLLLCFQFQNVNALASITNVNEIYVSVNGNDSNKGTIDSPLATIMAAQEKAVPGDTVYIRGGEYKDFRIAKSTSSYNYVFYFDKSGITYKSYNNEKVIFNFAGNYTEGTKRVACFFIPDKVKDITFDSFEVINAPTLTLDELKSINTGKLLTQSECFQSRGTNITMNKISCHDNNAIGFYFQGNATGTCYRCDAYNNVGVDSASLGNIDGFGMHAMGITCKECRAWDNSDDNYDCINSYGYNTFDTCWAFTYKLAKSSIQDGNGFKVGGWGKSPSHLYGDTPPVHIVTNCIAAGNKSYGFYSNHQPGQAAIWTNNTSYNNKANFCMTEGSEEEELDSSGKIIDIPGTREELYNNLSYKYSNRLQPLGQYGNEGNLYNSNISENKNKNNSWNIKSEEIGNDDFVSLDISQLAAKRNRDGSLPSITFMRPIKNSKYYGLGYRE